MNLVIVYQLEKPNATYLINKLYIKKILIMNFIDLEEALYTKEGLV